MQLNGGVDSNPFLRIEPRIYRMVICHKITHIARATGCSQQAVDYTRLNARLRFAQQRFVKLTMLEALCDLL